jgi:hypothetical protein
MTTAPTRPFTPPRRHPGPPAGWLAVVYTGLFVAGVYPVTIFAGHPYFPPPSAPLDAITEFFQSRSSAVLLCAFFQFGAAIPLGIFAASVANQLRFLGVRAAGAYIAFFGGIATAINMMVNSSLLWAMSYPGVAQDATLIQALYRFSFALGGPGFSVPFGLLLAGIAVTAGMGRLLPRWLVAIGVLIAVAGELSWFQIIFPKLLFLIPLTRFPGFLWLIAAGFLLPRSVTEMKAVQS